MSTRDFVKIENLTYTYPGLKTPAIDHLSFAIPQNSWTVVVGKNGSGKSTLIQLIAGLKHFNAGHIFIDGVEFSPQNELHLRQMISYLFQDPDKQFVGATVADDVAFGLENLNVPNSEMRLRVKRIVDHVGMHDYLHSRPDDLSGGQKQRIALAGALATNPQLLILDEATSMIDPTGRADMLKMIKERQRSGQLTVLSVTHDDDEIEYADNMVVLNNGKIVAKGSPQSVDSTLPYIPKPAGERLRHALQQRGIKVPDHYVSTKEMSKWIARQLKFNR